MEKSSLEPCQPLSWVKIIVRWRPKIFIDLYPGGFMISPVSDHLLLRDQKFTFRSRDDSWDGSTHWLKTVRCIESSKSFVSWPFDLRLSSPYVAPKGPVLHHYYSTGVHEFVTAANGVWWCREMTSVVERDWKIIKDNSNEYAEVSRYCAPAYSRAWLIIPTRIGFIFVKETAKCPQWSPALNNQSQQWVIPCWSTWQRSAEDHQRRWRGN